jgi:hypothetical protein
MSKESEGSIPLNPEKITTFNPIVDDDDVMITEDDFVMGTEDDNFMEQEEG